MPGRGCRSAKLCLICSAFFAIHGGGSAYAQVGSLGGLGADLYTKASPTREYSALAFGNWLLYPTVFLGGVYDDNVFQSPTQKTASWGARIVPSLLAEATDGIHATTLYGMVDARAYTDQASLDTLAARAGFIQRYSPTADLALNVQGDFTRQRDLFSTFGIDNGVTWLNPGSAPGLTGIGLSPVANPLAYNQISGLASIRKDFGRAFVVVGGSVVDVVYDDAAALANQPSPNGAVYTGFGRGGFSFTPFLYAYGEGSVDDRRYDNSAFNSNGYRVTGGIGSDQIGLFRGEVYAGYQAEQYDTAALGTVASDVLGGRLYYYPTPYLTIRGSVDQAIGFSLLATAPGLPLGAPTRVTTSLVQATYSFNRDWVGSARFGYIYTDYVETLRIDNAWTAGATIDYRLWTNWALTLDYQYLALSSNVPLQGFTRNVATLGLTYRY